MQRKRTFSLLGGACAGGIVRDSIRFNTPNPEPVDPTPVDPPSVDPEPVDPPAPQSDDRIPKLLKERKRAKATVKGICGILGIDPAKLTVKAGEDGEYRLVCVNPSEDAETLIIGAKNKGKNNSVANAELQSKLDSNKAKIGALIAYVKATAIVDPIRSACVKHKAVDDDNGQFGDIVSQLSSNFSVVVEFGDDDDDDGKNSIPTVSVSAVDKNGAPLINAKTSRMHTPDSLVADFLERRPKYRSSTFKPGPGAGGNNPARTGASNGNRQTSDDDRTAELVAKMFRGVNPESLKR